MSRSKDGYRPARQKTGESQLSIESIPDLPCENTCSVIPSERHEKLNFFERYRGFCTCLSGLGVLLVGFLLGVGYFSVTKTTRSVKYVETQIPTLVTASMVSFNVDIFFHKMYVLTCEFYSRPTAFQSKIFEIAEIIAEIISRTNVVCCVYLSSSFFILFT